MSEIRTLVSRTYNGVRVEIDEDRSQARIDIGGLPSWDLVGLVDRRIAPAVAGCAVVEVVGEDARSLAYLASELEKRLPHVEQWLYPSEDTWRGVG